MSQEYPHIDLSDARGHLQNLRGWVAMGVCRFLEYPGEAPPSQVSLESYGSSSLNVAAPSRWPDNTCVK